jgi:hypothetical protein
MIEHQSVYLHACHTFQDARTFHDRCVDFYNQTDSPATVGVSNSSGDNLPLPISELGEIASAETCEKRHLTEGFDVLLKRPSHQAARLVANRPHSGEIRRGESLLLHSLLQRLNRMSLM